jgi:hypothetical protein
MRASCAWHKGKAGQALVHSCNPPHVAVPELEAAHRCGSPAGNAIFFTVKRIEDPIGLLPQKLILGINKRGVHFFRPVPKEYLHSAELRDIMQFGSSSQVGRRTAGPACGCGPVLGFGRLGHEQPSVVLCCAVLIVQ